MVCRSPATACHPEVKVQKRCVSVVREIWQTLLTQCMLCKDEATLLAVCQVSMHHILVVRTFQGMCELTV